jgi:hypothetical protein
MELARITKYNVNLAAAEQLFSFDYGGSDSKEVIVRINLGDDSKPIVGGGNYVLKPYINDVALSPASTVQVQGGETKTIINSRSIPLTEGDTLSVVVVGLPGDTAVNAVVSIHDSTPLRADEVTGDGAVAVDHNYGGTDALTIQTRDGRRIDNATVLAFRRSDYANGRRQAQYAVAQTTTDVNGRWASAMMLDPGDYTLFVYRQGVIQSKATNLTVA